MANEVVSEGKVTQVIGPVVDVRFDSGELPQIYSAIELTNPTVDDTEANLILEVAQHIGDNVVRCVAMESTDGLQRGQKGVYPGKPNNDARWQRSSGPGYQRYRETGG